MIFRQILHPQTGCASYFFGCTGRREIAVCDPHLAHVDEYLGLAAAIGIPIGHIFETHVQADHVSGAALLAARSGAKIYLHEAAEVGFPHVDLRDGDEIALGNAFVRVLHTPGHSPDSVCLVVGDRTRGPDPWFVLTGDTLFVGDVGRPDLHSSEEATPYAAQLHDSLWGKLMPLDDSAEVYPAHFAGSACGRSMSAKPSSTIGFAAAGLDLQHIAVLAAVYPAVWGIGQLGTGALSDVVGRKYLIVGGMWTQAIGIGVIVLTRSFVPWLSGMALLGIGTALVYPTLLAAISDVAAPDWRASAVGVYRLWRDGGYALGALLAGILADRFGLDWAIASIAVLTFASGLVALIRMYETNPTKRGRLARRTISPIDQRFDLRRGVQNAGEHGSSDNAIRARNQRCWQQPRIHGAHPFSLGPHQKDGVADAADAVRRAIPRLYCRRGSEE